MSESSSTTSAQVDSCGSGTDARQGGLVGSYRQDHQNPVNHFLHVGVGWPMVAVSILVLPFKPALVANPLCGGLCDHVLRPFRFRAKHADDLQGADDAICDRPRRDPRSLERCVRLARLGRAR